MARVAHARLHRKGVRKVTFEVEFKNDAERKRWLELTKENPDIPVMVMFSGKE